MQSIYIESLGKVLKNKKKLEEELNIKILNKGRNIFIKGAPENEYIALKIIEAMELGFSAEEALLLKDEEIIFQIINIKSLTNRKDIKEVKARIIGTHGKTINNLRILSECEISLRGNRVGVIGNAESIKEAIIALRSLIQGSKQGNVYARLERESKKRRQKPLMIKYSEKHK